MIFDRIHALLAAYCPFLLDRFNNDDVLVYAICITAPAVFILQSLIVSRAFAAFEPVPSSDAKNAVKQVILGSVLTSIACLAWVVLQVLFPAAWSFPILLIALTALAFGLHLQDHVGKAANRLIYDEALRAHLQSARAHERDQAEYRIGYLNEKLQRAWKDHAIDVASKRALHAADLAKKDAEIQALNSRIGGLRTHQEWLKRQIEKHSA